MGNSKPAKGTRLWKTLNYIFIIFLAIYFINALAAQKKTLEGMEQSKKEALQKLEQLSAQREKLKREIELINTPSQIEKTARERLNLVKPGEIIFVDDSKGSN
jgi:cell division protein DivIC